MTDGIRTLIVDDDPVARRMHERFVAEADGFVVVGTAGTGEAAVREASRPDVDLVLLDIQLPGYSGVEVLNRLRAARGGTVDVIVVSSARDRVTVRQAASAHVAGYLVKPFTREALLARLVAYRDARTRATGRERDLSLGQGEIDQLVSRGASGPGAPIAQPPRAAGIALPKGVSSTTLARVRDSLDPVRPVTAGELADSAGLARATARRYLEVLAAAGELDISHRYGKRGRPEVLYRLAPQ